MTKIINKIKQQILNAAHSAGEGHIPSAFSILDLVWVLYDRVLKFDANFPHKLNLDHFVLSKGHASLALYGVLSEKNFFPKEKLNTFCQYDSFLGGHPDRNKVPGVVASTGSLGHGFPIALGIALASKIQSIDNRIFCLVGDGECNEGTIWETALLGSHHKLANLFCIVDYNHSTDRALEVGDLAQKFIAFGWDSLVINGHDHEEIYHALSYKSDGRPVAIIAKTIKGAGIKDIENTPAWHHRQPNTDELAAFIKELA
jgi:transketolase